MSNGKKKGTSKTQKKKEQRRLAKARKQNEEGAGVRIAQFGNNWQPLPVKEFAKNNNMKVNFAGWWDVSESGKKVEGTDPNTGFTVVMDSTKSYYRVQNANGQYVDASGNPQGTRGNDEFMAASHFKNSAK